MKKSFMVELCLPRECSYFFSTSIVSLSKLISRTVGVEYTNKCWYPSLWDVKKKHPKISRDNLENLGCFFCSKSAVLCSKMSINTYNVGYEYLFDTATWYD